VKFCEILLSNVDVKLAGLAVRDSLRLEAGLCLHGNEMNESITPVEADLMWLIPKSRKDNGGFIGYEAIKNKNHTIRRIGFIIEKGAPARIDNVIINNNGEEIGHVTSGTFSPCLKKGIGMGYIKKE